MSPARSASPRGRVKRGPAALQWIVLLTAGAVIMGLTFALGVLVGRQWIRPTAIEIAADHGGRKTVPPGKRGGLSAADIDPEPAIDQKLTFYQTLTAPLGRASANASQRAETKSRTAPEPARTETPPPNPHTSRGETAVENPVSLPVAAAGPPSPPDPAGLWSVQVAAFKARDQAASVQKRLKEAGVDAYIAPTATSDGQTNYRVRVGTFKSKAEAQRMVDKVRERSPAAFATPK